jgi:hypothetical protein
MQAGDFFKRLTGVDARACGTLLEVEQRVREACGQPASQGLPLRPYAAELIGEHGNVFTVSDRYLELDQAIDGELAAMRLCARD